MPSKRVEEIAKQILEYIFDDNMFGYAQADLDMTITTLSKFEDEVRREEREKMAGSGWNVDQIIKENKEN